MFDEVLKEKCYKKKHNALKTSDVMCRKNDNYIFFECKSTVPYAKTRCLDENYIKQEIDKISNYVLQLYKQVRLDFKNIYNFYTISKNVIFPQFNLNNKLNSIEESVNSIQGEKFNILSGKKYVACGDSFTEGDFTGYIDQNGKSGKESDAYDKEWKMYKTYPYWIAKRNNMTLINEAVSGSTITNSDDNGKYRFSYQRYKDIPLDADYITFKFGINDSASHQNMPIGTINDTDTTTFYGAWNVVLTYIIQTHPLAKLGILIGNGLSGSNDEQYCEAMRLIAKKYGIPTLDEDLDNQIPLTFRTNKEVDPAIAQLRKEQFQVSNTNGHPNLICHQYQSTFIENFLRSL